VKIKKKEIATLLINANRIYRYRRDVLSEKELTKLNESRDRLRELIENFASISKDLKTQKEIELLDQFLLKIGGKIYPKTFWIDNVEVGLVALVIVIGIRTFFFQPFIIPTNSMYPTYSGMNEIIYDLNAEPPSLSDKLFDKLLLGSKNYYLEANTDGRVSIPLFSQTQFSKDRNLRKQGYVSFQYVKGKKWFGLLPATYREYELYVGNKPVQIQVPYDYSLDQVILKTYFPEYASYKALIEAYHTENRINIYKDTRHKIKSGIIAKKGDALISFDITLGDALFVDRISYHFKKPKAGDPFVFKTSKMKMDKQVKQNLGDKYFIKRIGGVGGEIISIDDGKLQLDGEPRNEVSAFIANGNKDGEYQGYQTVGNLTQGNSYTIPKDHFFALGDNSYNSHDSRYFGPVNKEAVIGRAAFVYYPFTKRWGLSE
jgi:signal peptidase I